MAQRVTQAVIEAIEQPQPAAFATQAVLEIVMPSENHLLVTQAVLEIVKPNLPTAAPFLPIQL
ncbi:MAG: hypothetical protein IT160_07135 [Bryobacterales bacterium]|nr:hypothetical protein [Bryobacterales bacterium]